MTATNTPSPGTRKAQRDTWKRAIAARNAEKRRGRARSQPPQPPGYRVPPPGEVPHG